MFVLYLLNSCRQEDIARAEGNLGLIREAYATNASFYECVLAAPHEL